ncbi:hypothetical protein DMR_40580 [Solidesulfovibrio magneticus RS-1]|uniref:Uncharacterized protein n=1 Tax=Solidesulfovibrio magneticus (strain ATCC 700980 / DSM 13731 / RS-1) TaxID=573370 RepID=C4XP48_SOLM1|nr:hypothetical protein DMR_40580 [Solidesulfovibrio magneticus RS-1]
MINIIPNLYIYNKIFHAMKIKCLFGAMGTHDLTGINNDYCICEVGHGVGKRNNYKNSRLLSYYKQKFNIEKLFYLELNVSDKIYKENNDTQFPFLKENTFNFGMPEIKN